MEHKFAKAWSQEVQTINSFCQPLMAQLKTMGVEQVLSRVITYPTKTCQVGQESYTMFYGIYPTAELSEYIDKCDDSDLKFIYDFKIAPILLINVKPFPGSSVLTIGADLPFKESSLANMLRKHVTNNVTEYDHSAYIEYCSMPLSEHTDMSQAISIFIYALDSTINVIKDFCV